MIFCKISVIIWLDLTRFMSTRSHPGSDWSQRSSFFAIFQNTEKTSLLLYKIQYLQLKYRKGVAEHLYRGLAKRDHQHCIVISLLSRCSSGGSGWARAAASTRWALMMVWTEVLGYWVQAGKSMSLQCKWVLEKPTLSLFYPFCACKGVVKGWCLVVNMY